MITARKAKKISFRVDYVKEEIELICDSIEERANRKETKLRWRFNTILANHLSDNEIEKVFSKMVRLGFIVRKETEEKEYTFSW